MFRACGDDSNESALSPDRPAASGYRALATLPTHAWNLG
jgi:hypothetical protein